MQESSASENADSGESAQKQRKTPKALLREEVKTHRIKLEDICDKLDPIKIVSSEGSILVTNVIVQKFRVDINNIIGFFRVNMAKTNNYNFIQDTQTLCNKLDECMRKLNAALMAWNLSMSSGLNIKEMLLAKEEYQNRLEECRNLISEALALFRVK